MVKEKYAEFGLLATNNGWVVTEYDNETVTWEKEDSCFIVIFEGEFMNSEFGIIVVFGNIDF